ncbi:O-antigen/teichoic acid export membrane protein [Desulfitobacterium sp. LBE]|uniref:flippase n=1 Tax=Desulfitobacterium sp. LBE TaxID=884086 RepID=UPI00119B893B|nr:flippase [Desulfitobacterium sp. LBE]TWH59701.1 O-antigen/teichoic acid export membrane protein [Desulfitobacterium sp. LBE]
MDTRLLAKNATALGISSILAKSIAAVLGILVTRYLGPESYGDYSTAYAYVGTFILFAELGISQLMVQEGAKDPAVLPRYFGNTLLLKTLLCVLCYLAMLVFMFPAGYNETVRLMIVFVGVAVCFNAINQSIYNYYQAVQKIYLSASFQFLTTLLIALFTIIVLVAGLGVVSITFAHLFSYIIITILLYLALRKEIKPRTDLPHLAGMVWNGLPFGVHRIFYYLFTQFSILILSLTVSNVEVGIFSAAYKLVLILIFIPSLMTSALYPILYQLGDTDRSQHQHVIEKVFKVLSAVGIAGSMLMFVLAGPLMEWLYDGKFNDAIPIFMIVAWLLALECMSFSLGDILTTTGRQMQRTLVQGLALLLLTVLTFALNPVMGIYGAAYAVIIAEIFIFFAYYYMIRKNVYKIRIWRQLPGTLISSLLMAGTAWLLIGFHPLLSASLAGVVFCLAIAILDKDFRRIGVYILKRVTGGR